MLSQIPIKNRFVTVITIIDIHASGIVFPSPREYVPVKFDHSLETRSTIYFDLNGVIKNVKFSLLEVKICGGLF